MLEPSLSSHYSALALCDLELKKELEKLLTARALGNPYSSDGSFSSTLTTLPVGLRAMAATHWLDLSLTLDSVTWHFSNFGEPGLVEQTEAGLRELGLIELAECFAEAKNLMVPLLAARKKEDGDPYQILESKGLREQSRKLNARAWALSEIKEGKKTKSLIYEAWLRYTREHPDRVFSS